MAIQARQSASKSINLLSDKLLRLVPKYGLAVLALLFLSTESWAQTPVLTYHYDNFRTGQNTNETILTPANIASNFGALFSQPVDGQIYAQPLYMPNVPIPGQGTHNLVFVNTENDSVYAFDADSNAGNNSTPLWQVSLIDVAHGAAAGATSVPSSLFPVDGGGNPDCGSISPTLGSTSTPSSIPPTTVGRCTWKHIPTKTVATCIVFTPWISLTGRKGPLGQRPSAAVCRAQPMEGLR